MKSVLLKSALACALSALSFAAAADSVVKAPDLGSYWHPLSTSGTYTYADSFVAPTSGQVTELGAWFNSNFGPGGPSMRFSVLDSISGLSGNGPDITNVLASSGTVTPGDLPSLSFVDATSGISSASLVAGHTYWFAATVVSGDGQYQVGGHTQNSAGIVDNGTFWYSNDPTSHYFDGRGLTPEMAFSVTVGAVPEPSTYAMLGAGLGLLGLIGRKRRAPRA